MKNKKEFFGVLISVLICVLVVFAGVYAATTIGSNISTGGTLTVNGITYFNGTASISDMDLSSGLVTAAMIQVGSGTASVSYSRLGAGTTGHSLSAAQDLMLSGNLELDGTAYFDGIASISAMDFSSGLVTGDVLQAGGTTSTSYSRFGAASTTHGTIVSASSDVLISDNLEVDGNAIFDNVVSVSDTNGLMIGGGIKLFGGKASPSTAITGACVKGSWYFRAGQTASASIYYCATAGEWDDISGF